MRALAELERPAGSDGEAAAAGLLVEMMAERGLSADIELERSVASFTFPTAIAAAAGALAGVAGRRWRWPAGLLGVAAAMLMADDVDNGRQLLRRLLPTRPTPNVLAWTGAAEASETIVLVAHHDASRTGLLFHPGLVPLIARLFPAWYDRQRTSVHTGRLLVFGPAVSAIGAISGSRRLRALGAVWSAGTAALLADVARSPVVAGANDNLSSVAVLLALAERLGEQPPGAVRVLLLSTGSEETLMEGMRGFVRRHRAELDPAHTRVVALECVGSPHLMLIEGEGMLRMRDYDVTLRDELQASADERGIGLWRGLRLGAGGTDALPALRAGYRAACLAACDDLKQPANYHWPSDVPENLCWATIERAVELLEGFVRRVGSEASTRREPRYGSSGVVGADAASNVSRQPLEQK